MTWVIGSNFCWELWVCRKWNLPWQDGVRLRRPLPVLVALFLLQELFNICLREVHWQSLGLWALLHLTYSPMGQVRLIGVAGLRGTAGGLRLVQMSGVFTGQTSAPLLPGFSSLKVLCLVSYRFFFFFFFFNLDFLLMFLPLFLLLLLLLLSQCKLHTLLLLLLLYIRLLFLFLWFLFLHLRLLLFLHLCIIHAYEETVT